jgi:hypothetical protein
MAIEKKIEKEKRQSKRVFFSLEEGISARVTNYGDSDEFIPITLLSISSGGISFTGNKYKLRGIKEGDRLTLREIQTPLPLGLVDRAEVVVKYVMNDDYSIRLIIGCKVTQISGTAGEKIHTLVKDRLGKTGFKEGNY